MDTYMVFLRGINISGQKKMKMAELRQSLLKSGFENVQTYIQSGNHILQSKELAKKELEKQVCETILKDFGFEVPVLALQPDVVQQLLKDNPFSTVEEHKNLYFVLLHDAPNKENHSNINPEDYPNEEFYIAQNCVYINCKKGAGNAKLTNNVIELKLKVTATTRNLRTMRKMVELAG